MYKLLRSFLFCFDPERVHYFSMKSLRFLCSIPWVKRIISNQFSADNVQLKKECWGITFKNPVGLGAGFDKNAKYLNELEVLGFGAVEIGTVTPKPQGGNDKPRLFRLPKDKALINRMGFNNDGVEAVAKRLSVWQNSKFIPPVAGQNSKLIIGGNIGKNKVTPNEDAWKDYEICFTALHPYVDYFVVNVSSPNTPGLRELQEKDSLRKILSNLQRLNAEYDSPKPVLLKIAPDLTFDQVDDVIDLAMEIKLDGLVATNTTTSREGLITDKQAVEQMGAGGLSGLPVQKRSTEIVQYIHQKTNGQIPIIASGGIFTWQDSREKLNAGASLIQVWTGFIYEGPGIVKNICNHL
ncbi:MAG: quinone-dependent dihydroorotate dehydrogenase [Chitinophagaceae bacterium]|nr:quinone-dependent dihydroorotate dehydrogenase [Chitinophagaceae bacterium]